MQTQTQIKKECLNNVVSMLNSGKIKKDKISLKQAKINLIQNDFTIDIARELSLINKLSFSKALRLFFNRHFVIPALFKFVKNILY